MTKKGKQGNYPTSKKAIKVVHISNPMKFRTSASEFRSLVQKLTGREADITDIVSNYRKYPTYDDSEAADLVISDEVMSNKVTTGPDHHAADQYSDYVGSLELLDGAFDTPQPWLMVNVDPQGCALWGFSDE